MGGIFNSGYGPDIGIGRGALAVGTGGLSELWNPKAYAETVKNAGGPDIIGAATVQSQPGVGGPAANPALLVKDPSTGFYYDPSTGTSYLDEGGTTPLANPNVAQQVATNYANSQAFNANLGGFRDERAGAVRGQNDLATNLKATAEGRGMSAAQMQLGQGLEQIANQQQSQAAGVSGAASPLAQLMAARNTGSASVATNNAQAIVRAQEAARAQDALAQLLNNQVGNAQAGYNADAGLGLDYSRLAAQGQSEQQGLNTKADAANAGLFKDYLGTGLKFLGGGAAPV